MKRVTNQSLMRMIPKKYRDKIDIDACWWDEDEVLISTKDGWCYDNPGQHLMGFSSVSEIKNMMLFECHCEDCKRARK